MISLHDGSFGIAQGCRPGNEGKTPLSTAHLMQKRALIAMQYSALHNRTWKTPTVQKPCKNRAKTVQKPCIHGLQNKKAMKSFDFTAFSGASSDTELFKNHRSTICFLGHRIATCLYRTPMGGCIEKTAAFYIPHNLKIIKYAQRSLLPSPGANGRCFFCLQRKEASVKWQYFG